MTGASDRCCGEQQNSLGVVAVTTNLSVSMVNYAEGYVKGGAEKVAVMRQ